MLLQRSTHVTAVTVTRTQKYKRTDFHTLSNGQVNMHKDQTRQLRGTTWLSWHHTCAYMLGLISGSVGGSCGGYCSQAHGCLRFGQWHEVLAGYEMTIASSPSTFARPRLFGAFVPVGWF